MTVTNKKQKFQDVQYTGPTNPFDVDIVNYNILDYIPTGNYIFCAPVCKSWSLSWKKHDRCTVTDVSKGDSSISQIKECMKLGSETVTTPMLMSISKTGDLELLKTMYERCDHIENDGRILTSAVSSGNFEMVKWLFYVKGCSTAWDPLNAAAKRGDIELYKWLRNNDATRNWLTASKAASFGHLDMIKHIHGDSDGVPSYGFTRDEYDQAVSTSIWSKHVHVLDWLYETGYNV